MAIGMTLNQLYAPPSSSSAGAALTPPQGRSPKDDVKPMDRVYQMPYASSSNPMQQYAAPYPSPSTSSSMQYVAKPGPSTSEDYAADPLPFEYARKYSPPLRDDVSGGGLRATSSVVTSSAPQHYNNNADSYASHAGYAQPRMAPYAQPQYPEPRSYHHDMHFPRSTQMYNPMLPLPTTSHSFPPLLDVTTKKEVDAYPQPSVYAEVATQRAPMGSSGTAQEAMIKVKTPLKLKYWRNGRRNLQCFPSCKVFGDYSAIKIEDLKQHDFMWGKCRGSLVTEVTLNSNVTFDDLVLLGRVHSLENIPVAFEEAVIRECMLGRTVEMDEMDSMKDQWITGERLPDFVQQDGNVACFEFKPKVWKYTEDMAQGKCKRRNVKYYVQFEAFVQMVAGDRRYYACIGSGMSTSFEVGSSRVLARQKRKAASCAADAAQKTGQSDMAAMQQPPPPQQLLQHNSNPIMHNVMATHPMSNQMYAPAYHHDGQTRVLPPTFPHPQVMMNQMPPQQQQMPPEMHYPMPQQQLQPQQQQQQQQQQTQPSVGEKRKMSSDRPAFPTDRASKMLKPMSGVPQSVPI
ncbi:hypothetical protein KRP22_005804 [Phytophthora ramorum]|uniref:uncharacterized protein n=1 Tax=Phytophthora ramorum TaxID=164328 RepID=UPI0030ACC72B|nr:hypothetical protein KRP23_3698 [Phytophthora ramorum]KAH7507970.1 hypothetical protein KRP22_3064 [Phytophthora ramorum]